MLLLTALTCANAASTTVNVSAVILSKSICKFRTNAANLNFGTLNPITTPDITAEATLQFVCRGSAGQATYSMTDDDGLNRSGPNANRMQHITRSGANLPYRLSLSSVSNTVSKNIEQTLTVTGTIFGTDYGTAHAGTYSDTVTVTITP